MEHASGDFSAIWWILGLPVLGFLFQSLFGGQTVKALGPTVGKKVVGALAVLPIAIAFGIGVLITQQLAGLDEHARHAVVAGVDWISIAGLRIPLEVIVDPLSMTMVLIITGIGALIHLYATGYMAEEKEFSRFFTYLNLFIASMLILVLGNNLVLLFIGWEGVGVCSYLLIGFWYKEKANAKAANKAFIVNRIGDWGLTLGVFLILVLVAQNAASLPAAGNRWLSYDVILPALQVILKTQPEMATAIALLLFVGACGKSAQFPLYLWLPDAMAGPTPVSALIHAATMVTSGVVLLNRMHIVFEYSQVASAIVAGIGAFTALFAALIAFGQTDIKKVLAYSTVSQLGFMFLACGAGSYWAGMFHVTTHAFFKALLFLGSGAVIHAMSHDQDMRNYGNLRKYLPITFATMFIGWAAISGVGLGFGETVVGLAGFHSKEAVIGAALANHHAAIDGVEVGQVCGWIALAVAFLTAMYMTRMTWLTFFGGQERWKSIPVAEHHDDHGHDDHHAEVHHEHAHHDHGPDTHGFFFTEEELAAKHATAEHEHHHALDQSHTPHEVPPSMWIPLVALAILSVFGGFVLSNNHLFEHWLYPEGLPILGEVHVHPEEGFGKYLLYLSMAAAFGGIIVGAIIYRKGLPEKEGWNLAKWNPFRRSAANQFGYDDAMVQSSVQGGGDLGRMIWKGIDVAVIDGLVNGAATVAAFFGRGVRAIQTGYLRAYALLMLVGVVGLISWFIASTNGGIK
ncbi:MAG: NADH-quinone oxidoreductase subunit L [Fimbriimonas sp.]